MKAGEDEAEILRSVALQNARSINLARQHAENALAEQSEWLKITLSSIGDAVISTDALGRVTFLNGVAESLTGWLQADALGKPLAEIFHIVNEADRRPVENPALRALETGTVVGLANHTILISADGIERPIDDCAAPMRNAAGAIVGTVLVFRDITERKRAEETRARLAAIVESSQDAIISKSLDGTIRTWNSGAERLFGYSRDEAVGQPITLIIPEDRLEEERTILDSICRGERVETLETVRISKEKRRRDISVTVSPIRDSGGRIIGASKIARDIAEQKRAQEALREADRRKDEFLAILAHELRNPLAPLRNGLEVMRLAADDGDAVAQARGMMERQLAHMVRLIDDLLDISRINRGKMELRRTRVLLADVVSSAVETARPVIDAAGHKLEISVPSEPVVLDADLTRLAQVFGNLLTNSTRYTERGGQIWLTVDRRDDVVLVSVRDTGIGIAAESLPRIFDMFSQVERSIERSNGGLGIGLALVKGLVEMHGGTVTAESAGPKKGTTVTVRLPVAAKCSNHETPGPSESVSPATGHGRRVLVVDDNIDAADSLTRLLRILGNDVRTAHDGIAALATADDFRPELILMDMGMPRLNGYEATRRIRERAWGPSVKIIALTGWGQKGDKERSTAAGCDGHLVKPASLEELNALMASLKPASVPFVETTGL
jgi:PAS domain S-box-containing protein